ncbi:hypothetical protein HFO45_16970 [Rhizobium leguminosarum]|uniref:hypothetical protein n=1 Tax=Rhizobium leguminosarum TaxID=384 RepID=UPI001C95AB0F|nr:hypothetical protein [Rhizobium leguminosarum]MBY5649939.1 hypothetical protein [Rhizobium leguminosarum]
MNMKRFTVLAIAGMLCAPLAAHADGPYSSIDLTSEQTEFVKQAVAKRLKDPDSAKFPDKFSAVRDDSDKESVTVCGEVNGKNSFGAYSGATPFYISLIPPFSGPGTKEPFYALVTMIGGGEFEPAVVVEMCKEFGIRSF